MEVICPICGLPKELCVCGTIRRETERIKVRLELRRYNKPTTIIEGINGDHKELSEIAKKLKTWCACGGSVKEGKIILQGDQRDRIPELLKRLGFDPSQIEIT
ncbi:MAG: stress response translation initiation inhibitor YciH [Candidatus Methanomethylicota archaeon]|uniref:Protein translation factor SUI1 homolog n=1 Tax=Thermoproteota archaeon TaxID=2056631 RepID=A0A497EJG8_9CREN|nr:MAG: stress response translation initiation inhibitor YciH [Candidatus Verstraetearchaeota archaeon]